MMDELLFNLVFIFGGLLACIAIVTVIAGVDFLLFAFSGRSFLKWIVLKWFK